MNEHKEVISTIDSTRDEITQLQEDIQHAGYYGQNAGPSAVLTTLPNPCEKWPSGPMVTLMEKCFRRL